MAVINTNIMSLNAQRHLNSTQDALQTALERLSSGLRINSAKDDAAGMAIATRMTTQINGLDQATRNANDAISLSQTADGALAEVTDNLQRIRELAVQSANSTNSASDRAALDLEVQQRLAEVDRIASQTTFNGLNVLDGSFGNATFQVGANVGDTISIDLSTSMRLNQIGSVATAQTGDLSTVINAGTPAGADTAGSYVTGDVSALETNLSAAGTGGSNGSITIANDGTNPTAANFTTNNATFKVDGYDVTLNADYSSATDASGIATAIQTQLNDAGAAGAGAYTVAATGFGITITNNRSAAAVVISDADSNATGAGIDNDTGTAGSVGTTSFDVDGNTVTLNGTYANQSDLVSAIQTQLDSAASGTYTVSASGTTGIKIATTATGASATAPVIDNLTGIGSALFDGGTSTAGADGTAAVPAASLTLASGGFTVKVGSGAAVNITGTFSSLQDLADAISSNVAGTVVTVNDDNTLSIKAGDTVTVGGTAASSSLGFTGTEYAASGSLKGSDVLTADDANDMILRIDSALTQVNTLDSTFGAIENRFNSTIDNLSTTEENLTAARSRIQDADFAAETANLTRAQVLQQAGTAMVAQANSLPNTVLSLLR